MRGLGGGNHFVLGDSGVGKEEVVLVGELADEFALSAAVAFTEGVEGIDLGGSPLVMSTARTL